VFKMTLKFAAIATVQAQLEFSQPSVDSAVNSFNMSGSVGGPLTNSATKILNSYGFSQQKLLQSQFQVIDSVAGVVESTQAGSGGILGASFGDVSMLLTSASANLPTVSGSQASANATRTLTVNAAGALIKTAALMEILTHEASNGLLVFYKVPEAWMAKLSGLESFTTAAILSETVPSVASAKDASANSTFAFSGGAEQTGNLTDAIVAQLRNGGAMPQVMGQLATGAAHAVTGEEGAAFLQGFGKAINATTTGEADWQNLGEWLFNAGQIKTGLAFKESALFIVAVAQGSPKPLTQILKGANKKNLGLMWAKNGLFDGSRAIKDANNNPVTCTTHSDCQKNTTAPMCATKSMLYTGLNATYVNPCSAAVCSSASVCILNRENLYNEAIKQWDDNTNLVADAWDGIWV